MYKLIKQTPGDFIKVLRLEDQTFIRLESDSAEEKAYLKWLEEGNEPLPADEPTA